MKNRLTAPKLLITLLLVAVFSNAALSAYALRSNNLKMLTLREEVLSKDKSGEGLASALDNLRSFVNTHMHTELPTNSTAKGLPIQLTYSYQRAKEAEAKRVADLNAIVAREAQDYCQKAYPAGHFSDGIGRIGCIEQYTSSHGVKENEVSEEQYKYNFVSPWWSPDLAGWSIATLTSLSIVLVISIISTLIARINKKTHRF